MGPVFEKESLDGLEEVVAEDGGLDVVVGGQGDTTVLVEAGHQVKKCVRERGEAEFPFISFEELTN